MSRSNFNRCKAFLISIGMTVSLNGFAQVPDLDRTFGEAVSGSITGSNYDFYDQGNGNTDRSVTAFEDDVTGGYAVIAKITSPTAGKFRIGLTRVGSNGLSPTHVILPTDVDGVDAACYRNPGYVVAARQGDAMYLYALTETGALDTTVFTSGITSFSGSGKTQAAALDCVDTSVLVLMRRINAANDIGFGAIKFNYDGSPSAGGNTVFPEAGISNRPVGIGFFGNGRVGFVGENVVGSNFATTSLNVLMYNDTSLVGSSSYTIPIPNCGLTGPSSISKFAVHAVAVGNSLFVFGAMLYDFTDRYAYIFELAVPASGPPTVVGCGSIETGFSSDGYSGFAGTKMFVNNATNEAYVFGNHKPSLIFPATSPAFFRFFKSGGVWQGNASSLYVMNYRSNAADPTHNAVDGFIDYRGTTNKLFIVGDRHWLSSDYDVAMSRYVFAPLFANGFE